MKWTEVIKCRLSVTHCYVQGILAARQEAYDLCAEYLSRIPTTTEELDMDGTSFAAKVAVVSLHDSRWWKKHGPGLEPSVVKRIKAIVGVQEPSDAEAQQEDGPARSIPDSKVAAYMKGAILALQGKEDEAKEAMEESWYQSGSTIFTLPLEGIHLAACLAKSTVPVKTWIDAASAATCSLPQIMEASSLQADLIGQLPATSLIGPFCHHCWGIHDIREYAKHRSCPDCGGPYITANYKYSYLTHDINFKGNEIAAGVDVRKLPPAEDFCREFGFLIGQRGLGCIAAVLHFSRFIPTTKESEAEHSE